MVSLFFLSPTSVLVLDAQHILYEMAKSDERLMISIVGDKQS